MVRQPPAALPMTSPRRSPARPRTGPKPDKEERRKPARSRVELGAIIRSKIQPPELRASTLSRQRLITRLTNAVRTRLTLITAEAGYGKTTLLADFAAHTDVRTLWYRLDSADTDVVTWANYVVAAAREAQPDFGDATLALMSQLATGGPPKSAFVASVISELGDLEPVPTVLVLDDFHAVDESDEALEFVTRLLRDGPPWLSLVISSRRYPNLELGRLTASGELSEIETDELRFSHAETVELFHETYATPVDEEVLRELDNRLRGWVASLQLFHGSIRGRPQSAVRALARAVSGASSPIYDFLAEEVLNNIPTQIEQMLIRASMLARISGARVAALFGDQQPPPSIGQAEEWIEEADRLGLLARASQMTEIRQLHPLLKEFLTRELTTRESPSAIAAMHSRVADVVIEVDPLTATHHLLEAGREADAMRCLDASVMLTMGTGQWGVATELIARMSGVPADPAVAAIRARGLIEDGDLDGAAALLDGVDVSRSAPDARAVFRHTRLQLGWRTGNRELMFDTLREVQDDAETPAVLRDIFQIWVDASPLSPTPIPYPTLATRLERMARSQRESGHTYYAAISLHNAAIASIVAGRFDHAARLGMEALTAFGELPHFDAEKYSTHAILALCWFEQGEWAKGHEHLTTALSTGQERGDVHAECAYALAALGSRSRASQLVLSSQELERQGRSDVTGNLLAGFATALLDASLNPSAAAHALESVPESMPLNLGHDLECQLLLALMRLLASRAAEALDIATAALDRARKRGARRVAVRLDIIRALALEDRPALEDALVHSASTSRMALAQLADAVGIHLWLIPDVPQAIHQSIAELPDRWLPVLRRQLDEGGTANAAVAAKLLDLYGEQTDVPKLRAFAKTYRKQARVSADLGRALARRVAPILAIEDLGRTRLVVGARELALASVRRKSGALLMYLVTRPNHTASREQVLDELWPESDPDAASNNLNQSLYFLRRDIDPWFEDDMSVEYVRLQGDVVWLDGDLIRAASVEFASRARDCITLQAPPQRCMEVLGTYGGHFCPEFEYDDWAIGWRSRVRALFLELANSSTDRAVHSKDLATARDIAILALRLDPSAEEIERKLVWIYWNLGSRSAASAQYGHLASVDRANGLEPESIQDLVTARYPEG